VMESQPPRIGASVRPQYSPTQASTRLEWAAGPSSLTTALNNLLSDFDKVSQQDDSRNDAEDEVAAAIRMPVPNKDEIKQPQYGRSSENRKHNTLNKRSELEEFGGRELKCFTDPGCLSGNRGQSARKVRRTTTGRVALDRR